MWSEDKVGQQKEQKQKKRCNGSAWIFLWQNLQCNCCLKLQDHEKYCHSWWTFSFVSMREITRNRNEEHSLVCLLNRPRAGREERGLSYLTFMQEGEYHALCFKKITGPSYHLRWWQPSTRLTSTYHSGDWLSRFLYEVWKSKEGKEFSWESCLTYFLPFSVSVVWVPWAAFEGGGLQENSPSLEIDTQWYLSSFCLTSHPPGYNSAHRWEKFKANWSVSKGFMPCVFNATKQALTNKTNVGGKGKKSWITKWSQCPKQRVSLQGHMEEERSQLALWPDSL